MNQFLTKVIVHKLKALFFINFINIDAFNLQNISCAGN